MWPKIRLFVIGVAVALGLLTALVTPGNASIAVPSSVLDRPDAGVLSK